MENIDKIVENDEPETEVIENEPNDDNGVVPQDNPKPIEKKKKPRTPAQIEAWKKCLAKRKEMCGAINKAKKDTKEQIKREKQIAVEKVLSKDPNPRRKPKIDLKSVEEELEDDEDIADTEITEEEEEDEEIPSPVVVKVKKNKKIEKPKAKKKPKKIVYITDSEDEDEEDNNDDDNDDDDYIPEPPKRRARATAPAPEPEMDFRTKMRLRGF
tara:strand:- start:44 stop:682 length:639 start_codon:yes stop_codon:yes gene_type:complete